MKNKKLVSSALNMASLIIWLFIPQYSAKVHSYYYYYTKNYSPVSLFADGVYSTGLWGVILTLTILIVVASCVFIIKEKGGTISKIMRFAVPVANIIFDIGVVTYTLDLIRDGNLNMSLGAYAVLLLTISLAIVSCVIENKKENNNVSLNS